MNKRYLTIIGLIILLTTASTAVANQVISGKSILDNSIQATDLGTDVTRVKAVSVTVQRSEDDWICPDEAEGIYETCYPPSTSLGAQSYTVSCPSGNVTGGGVRLINVEQGYNLAVYDSYPSSDSAWTFDLYNTGPDEIPVQLRVICI